MDSVARPVLTTAVVILTAAVLRSPVVGVAPLAGAIKTDLQLSSAVLGLLTGIPILAFALCTPLAIAVLRKGGPDFALTVCLAGVVGACAVRSSGGLLSLLVGTALIGLFLTIGNVVMPVIVAREFPPKRVHVMTGVFTASFNIGTVFVTVSSAPLASLIGWRGAIAVCTIFGVSALAVWVGLRGFRQVTTPHVAHGIRSAKGRWGGSTTTWILAVGFAGQSFSFYVLTAWLPTLLVDVGVGVVTAGLGAALFQVTGIAGALLVPQMTRRGAIGIAVGMVGAAWIAVPLGFLIAPHLWGLWCVVGGLAQGGGLTVVFLMIAILGGGDRAIGDRSGLVQGVGYLVAAAGPSAIGAAHDATGAWTVPLLVIAVSVVIFTLSISEVARRIGRSAGWSRP